VISGLILEAATTTRTSHRILSERMPPRTRRRLDRKARAFAFPERGAVIKCQGTEVHPFLARAGFLLGLLDTLITVEGKFLP